MLEDITKLNPNCRYACVYQTGIKCMYSQRIEYKVFVSLKKVEDYCGNCSQRRTLCICEEDFLFFLQTAWSLRAQKPHTHTQLG